MRRLCPGTCGNHWRRGRGAALVDPCVDPWAPLPKASSNKAGRPRCYTARPARSKDVRVRGAESRPWRGINRRLRALVPMSAIEHSAARRSPRWRKANAGDLSAGKTGSRDALSISIVARVQISQLRTKCAEVSDPKPEPTVEIKNSPGLPPDELASDVRKKANGSQGIVRLRQRSVEFSFLLRARAERSSYPHIHAESSREKHSLEKIHSMCATADRRNLAVRSRS